MAPRTYNASRVAPRLTRNLPPCPAIRGLPGADRLSVDPDSAMSKESLPLFLQACGATRPLHLHVERHGRSGPPRYDFTRPFLLIGRAPETDVQLDDPAVSRHHAYLQVVGGRVFCTDLHSRTGLRFNGKPERSGWLGGRLTLSIGPFDLCVESDANPPAEQAFPPSPLAVLPADKDALPGVCLEILEGTAKQTLWRMNRLLALVGRSPRCKVRVASSSVLPVHCSLLRTPVGLWAVSLLAREFFVNGRRLPWALLGEGDHLQVGKILFRARYDAPMSQRAPALAAPAPPTITLLSALPQASVTPPPMAMQRGRDTQLIAATLPPGPVEGTMVTTPAGDRTDLATLLMPLTGQFAMMQQQMFDQFKQAMQMMAQMFTELHREQMGMIRQELDRLHQVTQSLQELQLELTRHALRTRNQETGEQSPVNGLAPSQPSEAPVPVNKASSPPAEPAVPASGGSPAGGSPAAAVGPQPADKQAQPPGSVNEQDFHLLITQRIAALQQERQSLWQRLFNFLSTNPPSEPPRS